MKNLFLDASLVIYADIA